jgi:hypothetical protein
MWIATRCSGSSAPSIRRGSSTFSSALRPWAFTVWCGPPKATDLLGDYPAVRYYPPSGDLYFDVMTRLGEAASFETVDAETKSVEDIPVRVATPEALFRLKRNTVRPLDREDAEALRRQFGLGEE